MRIKQGHKILRRKYVTKIQIQNTNFKRKENRNLSEFFNVAPVIYETVKKVYMK